MTRKLIGAVSFAALLLGATPSLAATIVIDNFDDNQRVEDAPGPGAVTDSQVGPSGNIIGGYRDLLAETDAVGQEDATELSSQNSALEFNNGTGVNGRGWATYDGANVVGSNPGNVDVTGLGGIDFLTGSGAGFLFEILAADLAGLYIEIRAWDIFGGFSVYDESLPSGGGNPFVPLTDFVGNIDWNQVGALQFFAQTGINNDVPALDGAIGSITVETGVIPLPASVLFMFSGFAALGLLRRRRRLV